MQMGLIVIPVFIVLILGVATQMEDIAKETSDKAIAFSDDMNDAMDCAVRGVPVSQCSPQLFEYEFSADLDTFKQTVLDLEQELLDAQAELEEQLALENETITP